MSNRLEHVAIYCKDINESIEFYRTHFGGQPTSIRKGSAGYAFCFVTIDGAPSIQLMESSDKVGVHHYGFISDDIEQAAKDFKEKNARILRENRDPSGKLTTIFVQDPHGLEMEIRSGDVRANAILRSSRFSLVRSRIESIASKQFNGMAEASRGARKNVCR